MPRTPLHEQYRPCTYAEVIGQSKVIGALERLRPRGLGGRAYWFGGKSGQGKSTLAKLLAGELADPFNVHELDASALTPAALADIEREAMMYGFGARNGRVYIVNEAHGLRADTMRQLLVWLERLPDHVAVIFTTTTEGQQLLFDKSDDASPLLSRCIELQLTSQGLAAAFTDRAVTIALEEGLLGPMELMEPASSAALDECRKRAARIVKDCNGNFRRVLQRIESGALIAD